MHGGGGGGCGQFGSLGSQLGGGTHIGSAGSQPGGGTHIGSFGSHGGGGGGSPHAALASWSQVIGSRPCCRQSRKTWS